MGDFSILTVCSGNICRSPLAEQLLRRGLVDTRAIRVSSAGTVGLRGRPMDDQSAEIAARLGVTDASAHVARELERPMVSEAHLILALAREHRRAIVEIEPRAARRTFTLREFARVAAELTDDDLVDVAAIPEAQVSARLVAAIEVVASMRGMGERPLQADDDDVSDPYRRAADVYERSTRELQPAVDGTVRFLQRVVTLG